ncbi:MAG: hypothetical protein WBA91_08960 [Paracoccaceae bacterium]
MVTGELDALKERFPACETLAFADLSTGMVLVTNSDTPLERRGLDQLCGEAELLLGGAGSRPLGEKPAAMALVSSQDRVRLFLRAGQEPNDALCCVVTPELDLAAFLPAADATLQKISDHA